MEKIVYTYALIKTLADNNDDYIDSFYPLVIQIFPPDKDLAVYAVQKTLRDKLQIEIPNHPLEYILNRAKTKGYLKINKRDRYYLTPEGVTFQKSLISQRDIDREINALLLDIQEFFKLHNIEISDIQVSDILGDLLKRNFEPLLQFFQHFNKDEISPNSTDTRELLLIAYIIEAEKSKPDLFKLLEKMFYGSLISTLLYSDEPEKYFEIKKKKFTHCEIFLDTNFVFSLLDLHDPQTNKSAKELFELIKKFDFKIKVFSFTCDEIARVISGYSENNFENAGDNESVYSTLMKKGWKKTDVTLYISNLNENLINLGITIENIDNFDNKNYKPKNEFLKPLLESYKINPTKNSINHDLAAIEKIKELRGHEVRNIEEVTAIFLTSDNRLKNFNYSGMGHKDNKTICEVFLDKMLTTMLWLINPKINLSLSAIISAHSEGLIKNTPVFTQFFKTLDKMKLEGKITEEQVNMLFYNNFITHELSQAKEVSISSITPAFIQQKIEVAKTLQLNDLKEKELLNAEREKYREKIKELQQTSDVILDNVKRNTHYLFLFIKSLIVFSILGIAIYVYVAYSSNVAVTFIGLVIALAGFFYGPIPAKIEKFEETVSHKRYQKLLSRKNA